MFTSSSTLKDEKTRHQSSDLPVCCESVGRLNQRNVAEVEERDISSLGPQDGLLLI